MFDICIERELISSCRVFKCSFLQLVQKIGDENWRVCKVLKTLLILNEMFFFYFTDIICVGHPLRLTVETVTTVMKSIFLEIIYS